MDPFTSKVREADLTDLLFRQGYGHLIPRPSATPEDHVGLDVFHANHVERFEGDAAGDSPLVARGNWLVSIRNLNAIMILSEWGGAVQRLPNGTTLITETAHGRAFEVTPKRRIVWEFTNPERRDEDRRVNIWRMTRVDPDSLTF